MSQDTGLWGCWWRNLTPTTSLRARKGHTTNNKHLIMFLGGGGGGRGTQEEGHKSVYWSNVARNGVRTFDMNKQLASKIFRAQLLSIAHEQRLHSIAMLFMGRCGSRGNWGAQTRNYAIQPYRLIKGTVSDWEVGGLEGRQALTNSVRAMLWWRRAQAEKDKMEI